MHSYSLSSMKYEIEHKYLVNKDLWHSLTKPEPSMVTPQLGPSDVMLSDFIIKAINGLFFTIHKTRTHPAEAELDSLFLIHNPILPAFHCFHNDF